MNKAINCIRKYNEITGKTARILCIYLFFLGVIEILTCKSEIVTIFASRLWLASGVMFLGVFVVQQLFVLINDIREKHFFILFFIGLLTAFFSYITFSPTYGDVNPDATQQLAAGLEALKKTDWNYTGTAFLGYASRQYIIAALPALVFGRSIITLHLGFGLLFLIAIAEFLYEMRLWLAGCGIDEKIAFLPVFSFLGFRFVIEYYMNFEQAITPVALTLLAIALFMKNIRSMNLLSALALAWIGGLLVNSYTPALASLCLLIVCLGGKALEVAYLNKEKLHDRESVAFGQFCIYMGIEANILLSLIASFIAGRSDRIDSFRQENNFFALAVQSVCDFFTDKNAVFLGFFLSIFVIYIVLAILGQLKVYDFLIAGWILCVIVFSNYLNGYTYYSKAWIMQRNMIIIPVFVTALFFALVRFIRENNIKLKKRYLPVTLFILWALGVTYSTLPHQSFTYFSNVKPIKYMWDYTAELCEIKGFTAETEFNIVLYTDNVYQKNIQDYCTFFYPNAHVYIEDEKTRAVILDKNLITMVFGEREEDIANYEGQSLSKSFVDKRYGTKHTWFVKVCESI